MKKMTAIFSALVLVFSLCACGGGAPQQSSTGSSGQSSGNSGIQTEEGLFSVEITLPASFFEGESAEEIQAAAKENGVSECTVNADGSVTYRMSKSKHKEMLGEMKASLEESIADLVEGEDAVPSFVKIEYNDDFSKFDVFVDTDLYTAWDNMYVLVFYISGAYYQAFSGTDMEDVEVVVNFVDSKTGEVLDMSSSSDWLDDAEEELENTSSEKAEEIPTIEETVVLDYEGVKVTATEYTHDSFWGDSINMLVENNSDKNVGVGCDILIINDYMSDPYFGTTVSTGKKDNESMDLPSSTLEAAGITKVGKIEVQIYLYDPDTYMTFYRGEVVEIHTSEYDKLSESAEPTGVELFNDQGVRIVFLGVLDDDFWGAYVRLYIENNTDQDIAVSCEDMSINGFMVDGSLYSEICAGKKAVDEITVYSSDLEQNKIMAIEEIELVFVASDSNTYSTLFKSGGIQFSAK